MAKKNQLFGIIDLLASEYGWSMEYCLKLPHDVVEGLISTIKDRQFTDQKLWTKLIGLGCAAGFSGKLDTLDKIFAGNTTVDKEPVIDETAWKAQVKGLWLKTKLMNKKDISDEERKALSDEFDKKWESEKNIEF